MHLNHLSFLHKSKENRLIELFHKMTDTANMTEITDVTVDLVDFDFDDT